MHIHTMYQTAKMHIQFVQDEKEEKQHRSI